MKKELDKQRNNSKQPAAKERALAALSSIRAMLLTGDLKMEASATGMARPVKR